MRCPHCLRGESENVDISDEYLREFFSRVGYINTLAITGGEPSIAVDRIRSIIKCIRKHRVEVGSFYIATNAKKVPPLFIVAVAELFALCDEREMCRLDFSNDDYHEEVPKNNIDLLKAFTFTEPKGEIPYESILDEGRGSQYCTSREVTLDKFRIHENSIQVGYVYLNCEGNIIAGCDWSYESQRDPEKIVCGVKDMSVGAFRSFGEREEQEELYEEAI
jgi:hypothetical protein